MNSIRLLISCFLLIGLVGCSEGTESLKEPSQDTEPPTEEKVQEKDESQEDAEEKSKAVEESKKAGDSSEEDSPEGSTDNTEAESGQPEESGDTEDEQSGDISDEETNKIVKNQFDIISDQLVANGFAPLEEWNALKYREHDVMYSGTYLSQLTGETATISIRENGERIISVEVAVPISEEAAYEKLCAVFSACTLNIFFTEDELKQIHGQLKNAETNTDVTINDYTVNYSEGIDIIILGCVNLGS